MSILAEFFVAPNNEAAAQYGADKDLESAAWPSEDQFDSGGLMQMHLELLWAILQDVEWDVEMADAFTPIRESEEEWLVRLPDDLVNRLAQASPAELDDARAEWAEMEEMGCEPDDLLEVTRGLQKIARRAVSTERPLYLWGSL